MIPTLAPHRTGLTLAELSQPGADERPEDYINKMKVSGAYVDELFLRVMACVLRSDIILIHLNKHTATNAVYTWLKGGEFLSETAGPKCPLFFGNVLFI